MTQQTARRGLFPTDPCEIEHVVELLVGEAHGETFGAPSELLREALAADLARFGSAPLPRNLADPLRYPAGYPRDVADLYVRLGLIAVRMPWADRAELAEQLTRAIERLALQRLQYLDGAHVETVAAALPRLRATAAKAAKARAGRAEKLPKARKALAERARDQARPIEADIRRRVKAGEQWRGMPGRVAEALGVPLSTAGDHVRRVRAAIEKENSRA